MRLLSIGLMLLVCACFAACGDDDFGKDLGSTVDMAATPGG